MTMIIHNKDVVKNTTFINNIISYAQICILFGFFFYLFYFVDTDLKQIQRAMIRKSFTYNSKINNNKQINFKLLKIKNKN